MGMFDIFKKRKQNEVTNVDNKQLTPVDADKALQVVLESLPSTFDQEENHLVEIKDPAILSRIDAVMPSASVVGSASIKTIKGSKEKLYKIVLKNGGELVDSASMSGAKRAFTMGKNGIKEHANLIEAKPSELSTLASVSTTALNVATFIVGQCYMQEIDKKIGTISDELKEITSTFDIQYRSQVSSLVESVYNISKYQMDTLSNEELRNRELDNVQELRKDCQTLLNQAEEELETILGIKEPTYNNYVSATKKIEKWSHYQSILVQILAQINELDFVLSMGAKTKEHCYGSFELHAKKLNEIHSHILSYHKQQCERLQIDVKEERFKRSNFVAKLIEKPISAINEEWMYRPLEKGVASLIKNQTANKEALTYDKENPFTKDVEIIVRGDKKYYLAK